ncbi:arsenite efflux ATP-binding protein ArsA [Archaeoglobus sulfaticallidus PM70-1]|uniref:Putative arsenical pump-driving ATPase n=1 Tax=Archaeoglobus sulfaticallidus PM70-1 TaxID=387631 RepID=N0BI03_9EURY|nr:ArsA family ATPase [Archaeoglobus sulfaticallidus]AGK61927.1 arsenite efflux ATP-binding protein ArsA [Archaeoglobus sulfaticallidus PM70-1]
MIKKILSGETKDKSDSKDKPKTRIILFTGKGGVGKTTVASATAIKTSKLGKKTLIISTDPAHSLSDSFGIELGPEPTKVRDNLFAMEVNIEYELEKHWETIKEYLKIFFQSQGIDDVVAEELAIFPGFDELASLLHLLDNYEKGTYEVIILDCAPTGETLRLLSVPEIAKWYMNRFFGIERRLLKIVKPIAEPVLDVPLPSEEVLDKIQDLYMRIGRLKEILESPQTSVRIVMNPEKMVIRESERAFTYLNLFGYRVDAVIINKYIPEEAGDYFKKWIEIQKEYLKEIYERFPVKKFMLKFKSEEVVGSLLDEIADELYDSDPSQVFTEMKPMEIFSENGDFYLSIKAPFVKKEDIKLLKRGEELIVVAGQWKRIIYLPQSLALKEPVSAKFMSGEIRIKFK